MTIPSGYSLVWSDEFDSSSLDMSKWEQRVGSSSNISVANSKLRLTANPIGDFNNGSVYITVKDIPSFQYGYFECSAANSIAQGVASAFWLLDPGTGNDEIDIYERPGNYGSYQNRVICSLLGGCPIGEICSNFNGNDTFPQIASGFHKYALLWTASSLRFYLDDVEIWNADSKASGFSIPLELKLDICADGCKFQGQVEPSGSGSTYSEWEYVRVYQIGGGGGICGQPVCDLSIR
jgi:beta-glucanase (GH16 family)